jgi:putative flippase GtrA
VIVFQVLFLFGLVGIAGFVVDTGILYLLKSALGLYYARLISFTCAVFATWILNRHLTFRKRASGLSLTHEFSRYFGLMLSGGVVNYVTYALLIYFYDYVARQPVWGVAAGAVLGLMVNYLFAKFLVFRGHETR